MSHAAAHAVRWGCLIGVVAELFVLVCGIYSRAKVRRLFLGQDNRISTSKTIPVIWLLVVVAAFVGIIYANLLNHPQALNAATSSATIGQYAVLFGGPLGAAILAKQIVNNQASDRSVAKTTGTPALSDLVANDAGNVDPGDFQYVLFNGVALFYVISTLLHAPLHGLPHIPDVLLGLTSVSAVGYVGKKALSPTDTMTAKIAQATNHGGAGTAVTIGISGVPPATQQLRALVEFGATDDGQAVHANVADGVATLTVDSPNLAPLPGSPVDVKVVTDDGAVLVAGKYTYQ